ncbi:hypothetical protein NBRC116601_04200 [Cognatishimia sp. WU-CL00825]
MSFVLAATHSNAQKSNILCDETVIKKQVETAEDKLGAWDSLYDKQREFMGKQPLHKKPEKTEETITGCTLQPPENGPKFDGQQTDDAIVEDTSLTSDQRQTRTESSDSEESISSTTKMEKTEKIFEKDFLTQFLEGNTLFLQVAAISILIAIACAGAYFLRYLFQITLGLLRRRRICNIPCSIVSGRNEVTGHITILGLNCSRFVPDGPENHAYLSKLLADKEYHFFDLIVGENLEPVFINGLKGFFTPCAFDKRLSVKRQKRLLAHSDITPQIGQLVSVPHDKKLHKKIMAARALHEKSGNEIAPNLSAVT